METMWKSCGNQMIYEFMSLGLNTITQSRRRAWDWGARCWAWRFGWVRWAGLQLSWWTAWLPSCCFRFWAKIRWYVPCRWLWSCRGRPTCRWRAWGALLWCVVFWGWFYFWLACWRRHRWPWDWRWRRSLSFRGSICRACPCGLLHQQPHPQYPRSCRSWGFWQCGLIHVVWIPSWIYILFFFWDRSCGSWLRLIY